mgnify:CR=1 FL=1
MLLYINNERCDSVEQLQSYFTRLGEGYIYDDLLDYGRHGDISKWLREMNYVEYADGLDAIDKSLGDTDFVNAMSRILSGNDLNEFLVKRPYDECFSIEGASIDRGDDKSAISLSVKVCSGVNESYEIKISTNWGIKSELFNPSEHDENRMHIIKYEFHKRPGKEFGDFHFSIEGNVIEVECTEHIEEKGCVSMGEEESMLEEGVILKPVRSVANGLSITISVSFNMIMVKGGTFKMGAQSNKKNSDNYNKEADCSESPVHSVNLRDYYIGETLVTQELWTAVMGKNPSSFEYNPQKPVENVSWKDCQSFIKRLNELTGKNFRLPTEAEWEYAARGGNKSKGYKYSGGNDINEVAWYDGNSNSQTHDVKTKSPNELGIYDMSGNVLEWCEDWFGYYSSSSQTNPKGPSSGFYRVLRGGSWNDGARYCRVSNRSNRNPGYGYRYSGFRLAL